MSTYIIFGVVIDVVIKVKIDTDYESNEEN